MVSFDNIVIIKGMRFERVTNVTHAGIKYTLGEASALAGRPEREIHYRNYPPVKTKDRK